MFIQFPDLPQQPTPEFWTRQEVVHPAMPKVWQEPRFWRVEAALQVIVNHVRKK